MGLREDVEISAEVFCLLRLLDTVKMKAYIYIMVMPEPKAD